MSASDDLSCQELVGLVTAYIEGGLPAAERARFDAHLALCPGCETYLDQMRQTIRVLGRLPEHTVAPAARDELLVLFRAWKRPPG